MLHAFPHWSVDEYVRTSRELVCFEIAAKSASKSDCFLHEPSAFVLPTAKPRVPAAETASGATAARAAERRVVDRILRKREFRCLICSKDWTWLGLV